MLLIFEELPLHIFIIIVISYAIIQGITYHRYFKSDKTKKSKNYPEDVLKQLWLIDATKWLSKTFIISFVITTVMVIIIAGLIIYDQNNILKIFSSYEEQKIEINKMNSSKIHPNLKENYENFNFNRTSGLISLYELKLQNYNSVIAEISYLEQDEIKKLINKEIAKSILTDPELCDILKPVLCISISTTIIFLITSVFSILYSRFAGGVGKLEIAKAIFDLIRNSKELKPLDKKRNCILGMRLYDQFLRKTLKLHIKNMDIVISEILTWDSQKCNNNASQFVDILNDDDQLALMNTWKETLDKTIVVDTWTWQKILKPYLSIIRSGIISVIGGLITIFILYLISHL